MFENIIQSFIGSWGYYAVFAMCALEGFGFFFVPGETTLMAAAVAAGAAVGDTHHLNIAWVLLAAFAGAVIGDNFSFLVDDKLGFRLLYRYGYYIKLNMNRLKFVQYLYLRYGSPIVFVGRFVMLLRAWESFLAGANGMAWRRFAPVNAAAIAVWVCVWGLGAWGLGQSSQLVLEVVGIGIFVLFSILFVVGWFYFRSHEDELEATSEEALPGPLRPRPAGSIGERAAKETPLTGKS